VAVDAGCSCRRGVVAAGVGCRHGRGATRAVGKARRLPARDTGVDEVQRVPWGRRGGRRRGMRPRARHGDGLCGLRPLARRGGFQPRAERGLLPPSCVAITTLQCPPHPPRQAPGGVQVMWKVWVDKLRLRHETWWREAKDPPRHRCGDTLDGAG